MKHKKLITLLLALTTFAPLLRAQDGYIGVALRAGNIATFGNFGGLTLEAQHNFNDTFAVRGGIMSTSYERVAADVRPSYSLDTHFGTLHFEALLHYAGQNDINNYVLGGCVGIDVRNLWVKAGYYHRTLVSGSDKLAEPFNIYYSFGASCLPEVDDWDLKVEFTNGRFFDLDRHYLPSLAVDGWWYGSDKVGVNLGVCYTPTGVFHISSDFYRLYTTLGICYRW